MWSAKCQAFYLGHNVSFAKKKFLCILAEFVYNLDQYNMTFLIVKQWKMQNVFWTI